ncbi:putative starch degradation products transport system permease protein AmyD [Clostridium pasteurianum DSM 525 = ATCC 6013]|uniref:ABC-type transporter, integral membrane subunit n=1 Tax=Clostridium pasteurianum DSM 525 = ATCC 6013 TaxID=1262449 RepID=A0A0H3JB79_CLOPA|nr:sugar ABC transporter permease [Clostridium pasteurianum]AJA49260.1 putative starch degradation products transport system permease protein AmyD [Clostridium pasteurianum DSM 525 = ATCC 6013]AJA53248.1 putative starch degradation products transport system permease protein AmyD [Clostridium pasteurianum DSM 525 = ATCC 6013]AOZ76438.1 sugar ABC transporter permease [Clostridium pasteurianum DSM 525 = ATCC 6013]AOZ80235.1 sugar ABC transporter permease [Clostridium pasteurianum]ELP58280.1 sugar
MKSKKAFYVMVIPAVILFFIFHTMALLKGIFYSFTNYKGFGSWDFVGIKNYIAVFQDSNIFNAYMFTFKFAILTTIIVNVASLLIAVGLNSKIKFKNTLKAVYFIPNILGALIVAFIFNFVFAHIVPNIGQSLNMAALSKNILGDENLAWLGIVFVAAWQAIAFNTIIYISGLQTIDNEVYEACEIDGANNWHKFKDIIFPLIAPFFTINMVLCMKNFLMVFDQVMAMTGGGPGGATQSISFVIYNGGFNQGSFAYQSANAVIYFIVIVAISLFQLRILEKREEKVL